MVGAQQRVEARNLFANSHLKPLAFRNSLYTGGIDSDVVVEGWRWSYDAQATLNQVFSSTLVHYAMPRSLKPFSDLPPLVFRPLLSHDEAT